MDFLPKILNIFQNMLIDFLSKILNILQNMDGWICCQTSGSHAPRPLLEGGKGKNGRGKIEVATTTNIWEKFSWYTWFEKTHLRMTEESQNKTTAVDICRVYQWEERLGIEREQNLSKSSPDLSRWTGCSNDHFFCMLGWSAMRPKSMLKNRW